MLDGKNKKKKISCLYVDKFFHLTFSDNSIIITIYNVQVKQAHFISKHSMEN